MNSSLLSKLFWFAVFFCFVKLVHLGGAHDSDKTSGRKKGAILAHSEQLQYPLFAQAYQKIWETDDPGKQLELIRVALDTAGEENFQQSKILKELYLIAADIHQERWHYRYAVNSLVKAQELLFDKRTDRRIKSLRQRLSRIETERNFNEDYIATRSSGPAKVLKDKVLVTYIFIDDGIKTRWSKKDILRTEQVLAEVERWSKQRSLEYNVDNIEFVNKTFIAQRNPRIKQLSAISYKSSVPQIEKFIDEVMEDLGEKSIGEFIKKQMQLVNAKQGVVIFHSNFDQRSFARRCGYTHRRTYYEDGRELTEMISNCEEEYVMLMNQVKRNRWDKLKNTQAHEILHLFGADDLYSIKSAANYAVTDIMNFQSRNLADGRIDPITAYAIGWQNTKPDTPFKVIER